MMEGSDRAHPLAEAQTDFSAEAELLRSDAQALLQLVQAQQSLAAVHDDPEATCWTAMQHGCAISGAESAAIYLNDGQQYACMATVGSAAYLSGSSFDAAAENTDTFQQLRSGPLDLLRAQNAGVLGTPFVAPADEFLSAFDDLVREHRSVALVACRCTSAITGVLLLGSSAPEAFTRAQLSAVQMLCDTAALEMRSETDAESSDARREMMREIEERFRIVTESVSDAVITVDEAGRMLFANRAAENIFGFTVDQLLGDDVRLLLPDFSEIKGLMDSNPSPAALPLEMVGVDKDGQELALLVRVTAIPRNHRTFYTLAVQDVTARRTLEAQLRQSQKLEAIGRLAGGLAHEYNNLVTIITGHADFVLKHLGPKHRLRTQLREIKRGAERVAALTRQLLAFSRRQVLAPQVLDLNVIVATMEKMLRRLIGEDIELSTVLQLGLERVKADPAQIEQLILNVVASARNAMPGGGKLTIQTTQAEIRPESPDARELETGRYVVLSFTHSGSFAGRVPLNEVQPQLFDAAQSFEADARGVSADALTAMVEELGARTLIESQYEGGVVIRVFFAPAQESGELIEMASVRETIRGGSETVLLVEDEDAVRHVVSVTLKRRGYTVLEAATGAEALQLLRTHAGAIDLLLTDMVMPRMSGRELAQEVRKTHSETRVLYVSGYAPDPSTAHPSSEKGVWFLEKPFTPDDLARKVREVLDQGAERVPAPDEPIPPKPARPGIAIEFPGRSRER